MESNVQILAKRLLEKSHAYSPADALKTARRMLGITEQISVQTEKKITSSYRPLVKHSFVEENKRLMRQRALEPKPLHVQADYDTPRTKPL